MCVICYVFENIVCEYLLVISSKRDNKANGDSKANHLPLYYGFRGFGAIIGSYYSGRLIEYYGNQKAFYVYGLL